MKFSKGVGLGVWIGLVVLVPSTSWAFGGAKGTPPSPPIPMPTGPEHGNFVMRVMTYNIQGLPLPGMDFSRFDDIGKILKARREAGTAPHLIVMQEGFDDSTDNVAKISGYPYVMRGIGSAFLRLPSGLIAMSEYPIVAVDRMEYKYCISWDCIARKGAMHLRINVDGIPYVVDLYDTHMNSDPDSDKSVTVEQTRGIRATQIVEYRDFVTRTRTPDSLVFAPGDFNLPVVDPGYDDFLGKLMFLMDGGARCMSMGSCEGTGYSEFDHSYDHVFYSPMSQTGHITAQPVYFQAQFAEEVNGRMLSDHLAQEVHYFLNW